MFQFDFDLTDGVDEAPFAQATSSADEAHDVPPTPRPTRESLSEMDLDSLLEALPTQISYSFVCAPSPDGHSLKLARRDLFDVRFQLISEGTGDPESADPASVSGPSVPSTLQFIDNPSDLIPLIYEGGLKTWECSLDLASCLRRDGHGANARGRRVLELGCGTAIPTLAILQDILSSSPVDDIETHIHLQDYNASVLQLVTVPNIVLAWYTSPAADVCRATEADASGGVGAELHITPQLLGAFKTSLHAHGIRLRFFSGSWDAFDPRHAGGPYHLVLTSETIYHQNSLPSLVRVMRDASSGGDDCLCLVAAKTVYFGVGGGIAEFVRCVGTIADERQRGARVEAIWETSTGVNRQVMRVWWT